MAVKYLIIAEMECPRCGGSGRLDDQVELAPSGPAVMTNGPCWSCSSIGRIRAEVDLREAVVALGLHVGPVCTCGEGFDPDCQSEAHHERV